VPIVDTHPIGQRAPWAAGTHHTSVAPAKRRILETANRLFYDEGIRSVGIDRLISESGVTKATFYKHYGSKDRDSSEPKIALQALIDQTVADVVSPGFRGCAFINAATEFTDSRHAVRQIVSDHREWYAETLSDLLKELGHPLPGDGGDELMLARDGVMTGGYAGDPIAATTAYVRVVGRVLDSITK